MAVFEFVAHFWATTNFSTILQWWLSFVWDCPKWQRITATCRLMSQLPSSIAFALPGSFHCLGSPPLPHPFNQSHLQFIPVLPASIWERPARCQIVVYVMRHFPAVISCLPARFRPCLFPTSLRCLPPGKPACLLFLTMRLLALDSSPFWPWGQTHARGMVRLEHSRSAVCNCFELYWQLTLSIQLFFSPSSYASFGSLQGIWQYNFARDRHSTQPFTSEQARENRRISSAPWSFDDVRSDTGETSCAGKWTSFCRTCRTAAADYLSAVFGVFTSSWWLRWSRASALGNGWMGASVSSFVRVPCELPDCDTQLSFGPIIMLCFTIQLCCIWVLTGILTG